MRIASLFKLSSAAFLSSVIGAATVLAISPVVQAKDQFFQDGFLSNVDWQVEPYIGADAMTRVMRYKDEPTHPFQEHLDTFQPFVGVRLHKYFGVEAAYQQSEKGMKERAFFPNQMPAFFGGGPLLLAVPGPNEVLLHLNTTTMIKGWNLALVGFYPICKDKTELFAKVGYSNLSLNTEYRFDATILTSAERVSDYGNLQDDTGMFNLALGLKHSFSEKIGGRLFVSYDRTSRLHLDSKTAIISLLQTYAPGTAGGRGDNVNIKPHNSWLAGVGLYYTWK